MAWNDLAPKQFVSFTNAQDSPFSKHYGFNDSNVFMTKLDVLYYLDILHSNLDILADNQMVWKELLASGRAKAWRGINPFCIQGTTYNSVSTSGVFNRNNCNANYVGGSVTYTVNVNAYTSMVSQADADSKALADVNANGQAYANSNGTCTSLLLSLGDSYGGGLIAYILQPGDAGYDANIQHGLIVASTDQSTGIIWHGSTSGNTGATGTAIGSGRSNTSKILALYGLESNAAKLCDDLVLNGYSDWYLPSAQETLKVAALKHRGVVFSYQNYWSSSEYYNAVAHGINFNSETIMNNDPKTNTYAVRAIRSF